MKQSRQDDIIQDRMRPGVITRDGLLGHDRRPLRDILEADDAEVRRLGLTHAAIAARMRALRDAGAEGLGEPVTVLDHFEVRVDSVRGLLPCPFPHEGLCRKEFVDVRNLRSGGQVVYTELNIHLIEAHGFYEGLGAPFRQEPAILARVLEI
ncbi:MAG TPA: hypothetical protein P5026_08565 [Kiritimatiellia bacterium]|nr:hypothetical protein [Kiritimatiellia bacterium]HRU70987.1 hypothetical protein [Kiritimatiellia bacterium]